jgi:hypothetical protein
LQEATWEAVLLDLVPGWVEKGTQLVSIQPLFRWCRN